jgi:hypothetical protein
LMNLYLLIRFLKKCHILKRGRFLPRVLGGLREPLGVVLQEPINQNYFFLSLQTN